MHGLESHFSTAHARGASWQLEKGSPEAAAGPWVWADGIWSQGAWPASLPPRPQPLTTLAASSCLHDLSEALSPGVMYQTGLFWL